MKRRALVSGLTLTPLALLVLAACEGTQAAAPKPTATASSRVTPTAASPFQVRVRMAPQEARLGTDEQVVIQASFVNNQGRPVPGARLSAIVHYPSGPKTFKSEVTTFQDGRADLAVPVAPATRGVNVRVEVIMSYQGQEYRANAGFRVV
ncbi:MAG: hypothetical protein HY332_20325 [Chloroflexi bacterium]|nr:hypothetical protein [Chloroflexota bacterium]